MANNQVLTSLDLSPYGLKHIASGKVREIFEIDAHTLLFVATDRISAYDVILDNGVPNKGALLTKLSACWFGLIKKWLPELRTHLVTLDLPLSVPSELKTQLEGRCMQVRRYSIIPLESIVRGYITGSAWSEYKSKGTIHGMPAPSGLQESQRLDEPMWTPSTKAEQGEHDENIDKDRAIKIVGADVAKKVEELSLKLYCKAREYAETRGIIIADTKFEFGLDDKTGEVVLVDEVLTPDSSRFWPADKYVVGKSQESYDKQYLRDWLTKSGLKGKQGVSMPEEVVKETESKYTEAYQKLCS
ncbi:hypothetical protein AMS68_004843 [Peltaster fructicola]|uniref:Phosphoribosylaminoimidazole-succinocarboxamide synthase n=1 Tax=Peltaster fructicola TaxID=286661 RepID=A0A6H0XXB7_9PEZI|nr:hypothetical protein AMS68_004843 [Peltaster fructicola]